MCTTSDGSQHVTHRFARDSQFAKLNIMSVCMYKGRVFVSKSLMLWYITIARVYTYVFAEVLCKDKMWFIGSEVVDLAYNVTVESIIFNYNRDVFQVNVRWEMFSLLSVSSERRGKRRKQILSQVFCLLFPYFFQ